MGKVSYDADFYGWANEQAALLRTGRLSEVDLEHVAEEIEDMGRSAKRELVNRLTVLLAHLLKWEFQPDRRGTSWEVTIIEQRERLVEHLQDNPSLKPLLSQVLRSGYRYGTLQARREAGLSMNVLPASCPYTIEQVLDENFWPGAPFPAE